MENNSKLSFLRPLILIFLFSILIISIILNVNKKPSTSESVWNKNLTLGDLNSKNHYIIYSDFGCPYCMIIARQLYKNQDELEKTYIKSKNILLELRVTEFIYQASQKQQSYLSRQGGKASYCAAKESKFWDFYHLVIDTFWEKYQSKGIAVSSNSKPIPDLPDSFWLELGKQANLSDNFKTCYEQNESLPELENATKKYFKHMEQTQSGGMPYMQFNKYSFNGIPAGTDFNKGWENIKMLLENGLID